MTEKEQTQEQQDTMTQTPAEESGAAVNGGHSGAGLGILALLISLGAAIAAGWLWFHQQSVNVALHQAVSKAEQGQKETGEKLAALTAEFGAQKSQTANALSEAASKQSALENSVKQVYIDISNNRDVWKLEEVDQLLTVAGERMQLANDKKTALAALQLADKRLATMGDPALLPLREKVTDAIGKLKTVGEDDVSGVALKIRSLIKQVDELPFDYDPKLEHTSSVTTPAIVYAAEESGAATRQAQPVAPTVQTPEQLTAQMPEQTAGAASEPAPAATPETGIKPAAGNGPAPAAASTPQPLSEVVESAAQQTEADVQPPLPVTAGENASTHVDSQAASDAGVEESPESQLPVTEPVAESGAEPAGDQAGAAETSPEIVAPEVTVPVAVPGAETPMPSPAANQASAPEKAFIEETSQPETAPAASESAVAPALQKLKQGASKFFDELWNDTKKAFDYQVLDRAAKPLLTPDQKYFVTENIKLALSAAQLAALQGDETTYRDNLAKAGEWANQYFAAGTPQLKSFKDTLAELQKVDVSPEWPDISGVLQELRAIKERKAGQ